MTSQILDNNNGTYSILLWAMKVFRFVPHTLYPRTKGSLSIFRFLIYTQIRLVVETYSISRALVFAFDYSDSIDLHHNLDNPPSKVQRTYNCSRRLHAEKTCERVQFNVSIMGACLLIYLEHLADFMLLQSLPLHQSIDLPPTALCYQIGRLPFLVLPRRVYEGWRRKS